MLRTLPSRTFSVLACLCLAVMIAACSSAPPPPTATADTFDTLSESPLSIAAPGVLDNDVAQQAEVSAVNGQAAALGAPTATAEGGEVTLQADGGFEYQPATSFAGTDTFTYTVTNVSGSDEATVSIVVTPLAPVAVDDDFATRTDTNLTISGSGLLANDSALTAVISAVNGSGANVGTSVATTDGGQVTVQANGGFEYTPALGYTGTDSFTYTVTNESGSDDATAYVLVTDPWTTLDAMPDELSRPSGVFWDGRFFVVGGEPEGGVRLGQVHAYDTATGTWETLTDAMPTPTSNQCAVVIDGKLHVLGGYLGAVGTDSVQVLDLTSGTWSVDTDALMPEVRFAHACAAIGDEIYVFGGGTSGGASNSVWRYDPELPVGSRWETTLAPLPAAVEYAAAVTVGDKIFVTGSDVSAQTGDVWAYLPETDEWETYPDLQTVRTGAAIWSDGETLFVGGGGWSTYLSSVEAYDLSDGTTGAWEYTDSLLVGRRTFAYGMDPETGHVYFAGGWNGDYLGSLEVGRLLAP